MNCSKIKQILPVALLALILAVAYLLNVFTSKPLNGKQCTLTDSRCTFIFQEQLYQVEVNPAPIQVEEEHQLVFTLPDDAVFISAWIEGVNMFMGRSRILIDNSTSNNIEGRMFLGSCSEPNMRWRLVIEVELEQGGRTEHFYVNFATST